MYFLIFTPKQVKCHSNFFASPLSLRLEGEEVRKSSI